VVEPYKDCITDCATGSIYNNQTYMCSTCHSTCKTCNGTTYTDCESCYDNSTLIHGMCV
jgi:hypothetical protein